MEKHGRIHKAVVVAPPGRSAAFREILTNPFDTAETIHAVELGIPADAPLDLYLPTPATRHPPKPAWRATPLQPAPL